MNAADLFDELAGAAARGMSRRQMMKLVAGSAMAGLLGARALHAPAARADAGCSEPLVPWTPSCMQPVPKSPPPGPLLQGCNPALMTLQPVVGADMRNACTKLDLCYGECNASKPGCDAQFLLDMQTDCFAQIPPADADAQVAQMLCLAWAASNHLEQQGELGTAAYNQAQAHACDCCGCDSDDQCAAVSPGLTCCSSRCVDKQSDPNNCGSCGHVCPGGTCSNGQCPTCPPGSPAGSTVCGTAVGSDGYAVCCAPDYQCWGSGNCVSCCPNGQMGCSLSIYCGVVCYDPSQYFCCPTQGACLIGQQCCPNGGCCAGPPSCCAPGP